MDSESSSSLFFSDLDEDVIRFALAQGEIVTANFNFDRIAEGSRPNQRDPSAR
jgi:hypothetical protein